MNIYAQNILDRYKKPYHKDKEIQVSIEHEEVNHSCGDKLKIELEIESDKIKNYTFTGVGCAISQASADILGDLIIDEYIESVENMTKDELFEVLGIEISPRRTKCALMGLIATQKAIQKL